MTPESPRVSRPELSVFSSGPLLELWVWRDHTCLIYLFFAAANWNEIHKIQYYCIAAAGAHKGQNIYEVDFFIFLPPAISRDFLDIFHLDRFGLKRSREIEDVMTVWIKIQKRLWLQCDSSADCI